MTMAVGAGEGPAPIVRQVTRRPRWRMAALVTLSGVAVFLVTDATRRYRRQLELKAAVEDRGGSVQLERPAWQQVWSWWEDGGWDVGTQVVFRGTKFNSATLRRLDDLQGLEVRIVHVLGGALTGEDVARLATLHPVVMIRLHEVRNADQVARALSSRTDMLSVWIDDSDLTDAGLRQLPLERLGNLFIPGTHVTSTGLREVGRCEELRSLMLDGRQFDEHAVDVVASLPKLRFLGLQGPDVTDEHLRRLRGLKIEKVHLENTSTTPEAIAALKESLPGCVVEVK